MGGQPNLYCFPSAESLAVALRVHVIRAQKQGLNRHGVFKVAISGGSLPKTLGQALLASPADGDDKVQWDKWEIFLADERAVSLDHPDSNYRLLKSDLLDHITATPPPVVHAVDEEHLGDTQELADQYEQTLVRSFASRDSVKLPIFDLILLGCGPDGHTCSLFPGHALLRESLAWVAPIDDSPKPPKSRITLTLPVITHAVRVTFVATGEAKRDALRRIFDEGSDSGLPSALVNEMAGERCSWFVDAAAVKGLSFPKSTFL